MNRSAPFLSASPFRFAARFLVAVAVWHLSAPPRLEAQTTEAVEWTNLVNATGRPGQITKSAGVNNQYDAGGVSTKGLTSSGGYLEFRALDTTTSREIGLS